MWTLIIWIVFLGGSITLLYCRLAPWIWLSVSALLLIMLSTTLSLAWIIIFWLVWLALAAFILLSDFRLKFFTRPFIKRLSAEQINLSTAERDALASGDVWWEGQFFTGEPEWEKLFNTKAPNLTDEEQAFLDQQVSTLCAMLDDWKIQQKGNLPNAVWDYLKKEKFWALIIPKAYGGLEFSPLAHSTIIHKIASRNTSAAIVVMVPNSLGPAEFLLAYGTKAQKDYYLPRLASGEDVACFALTSLYAGSDASNMTDQGVICKGEYEGHETIGIRLNFHKRYITLAPMATLIGLAFNLQDPDNLLGEGENIGITVALVPSHLPGVKNGSRHSPLNLAFPNGTLQGEDVFIPLDFVIGGREKCGQGWRMLMECLGVGRGISLPSLASAMIKVALLTTSSYSQLRQQFKRPIGDFAGVAKSLANIAGFAYISEAVRIFTAQSLHEDISPAIASAIAKYHLTEFAREAINFAMDIHAGRAIQAGPRNYLISLYQTVPIGITVEGANILTRNLIIFGQGLMRSHPFLSAELLAAEDSDDPQQNRRFDKLLLTHIGFSLSRMTCGFIFGITNGCFISVPKDIPELRYYLQQTTRLSTLFVIIIDLTLLILGNQIKLKETLSARLGDIVSYLYMASAVMKYYAEQKERKQYWPVAHWSLDYCLAKVSISLNEFIDNFPKPKLARLVQRLMFPWQKSYKMPADKLSLEVARLLQKNPKVRQSLTQNCYVSDAKDDPIGRVEIAYQAWQQARSSFAKLRQYKQKDILKNNDLLYTIELAYKNNLIDEKAYQALQHFAQLQVDALEVDVFID